MLKQLKMFLPCLLQTSALAHLRAAWENGRVSVQDMFLYAFGDEDEGADFLDSDDKVFDFHHLAVVSRRSDGPAGVRGLQGLHHLPLSSYACNATAQTKDRNGNVLTTCASPWLGNCLMDMITLCGIRMPIVKQLSRFFRSSPCVPVPT